MEKVIGGEFSIPFSLIMEDDIKVAEKRYSSGRCALYVILKDICNRIKNNRNRILVPNYLCDSITRTICDANWNYEFYNISEMLEYRIDEIISSVSDNEVILLINYFGMGSLQKLIDRIKSEKTGVIIIVDNVQAYYEMGKLKNIDYEFTSYRKWFLCPDGATVTKYSDEEVCDVELSENKFSEYKLAGNLLKENKGYISDEISLKLLKKGEEILDSDYLCKCSDFSNKVISKMPYEQISDIRRKNAYFLHKELEELGVKHMYKPDATPLFIPIFVKNRDMLRKQMFEKKIFTPAHWPVTDKKMNGVNEIYNEELSLICDQRYNENDMLRQIKVLKENIYKD